MVDPLAEAPHDEPNTAGDAPAGLLFSNQLESDAYTPWKDHCLNYNHLKKLLKEGVILRDNWTDKDEQNFVSALDADLEKVYTFQHLQFDRLNHELDNLQRKAENLNEDLNVAAFSAELDNLLSTAQELEHFQRINYTGFIKIVKKHDRLHPQYSVKPLLNVRLKSLPFHSEDYSPILYKIGALFQFLRENYAVDASLSKMSSMGGSANASMPASSTEYQSFKFWVHPDNLMETKTRILRHLPVLVYLNGKSYSPDEDDDDADEDSPAKANDQTINCLYLDNSQFDLYNSKLKKLDSSYTMRIKWISKLSDKPKITLEKKMFDAQSNFTIDEKILLKQKYASQFIIKHEIAPKLKKINDEASLNRVLALIKELHLQPVLRTMYKRTAFQIPGDNTARVIIDSDIVFIREDSFDEQLPIRDPANWHRTDIDSNTANPLQFLRKGEYAKFPYSEMEIKVKKSAAKKFETIGWINELIESNLVKEIPNFSKFVHGVAALFVEDDHLNNVPLWYNELESDWSQPDVLIGSVQILGNPKDQNKVPAKMSDQDNLSKFKSMVKKSSVYQPRLASFSGSIMNDLDVNNDGRVLPSSIEEDEEPVEDAPAENHQAPPAWEEGEVSDSDEEDDLSISRGNGNTFSKLLGLGKGFSKLRDVNLEDEEFDLPEGVVKPSLWIKNAGPLKIEPKVYLANERTYVRWLHVTALFATLTFTIYSSSKRSNFTDISDYVAYMYFGMTMFTGFWAYYVFMQRSHVITERSGKHLDNILGPLVVALVLIFTLTFNFILGWKQLNLDYSDDFYQNNEVHKAIHGSVSFLVNRALPW